MNKISRRELLRSSAVACGAALTAGSAANWSIFAPASAFAQNKPSMNFPTAPRDRLAVASWPFRAEIVSPTNDYYDKSKPGVDLRDWALKIPKEFGVNGVEPLSSHFPSTDAHYLESFRKAIEGAHIHVVNIPVDNEFCFFDSDLANRKKAIANSQKWIDIAVAVGSPSVRTSMGDPKNSKPNVDLAADSLKQVAEYGAQKNVQVNLENDNPASEDPVFLVEVLGTVSLPYLHALPDFCNSMASSNNTEFNDKALKMLFPRAYNICHVKDSEVGEGGKVFRVDVKRCFDIVKAANYRGYFSMEWEGPENPYEGTKRLIAESLKNLS